MAQEVPSARGSTVEHQEASALTKPVHWGQSLAHSKGLTTAQLALSQIPWWVPVAGSARRAATASARQCLSGWQGGNSYKKRGFGPKSVGESCTWQLNGGSAIVGCHQLSHALPDVD